MYVCVRLFVCQHDMSRGVVHQGQDKKKLSGRIKKVWQLDGTWGRWCM